MQLKHKAAALNVRAGLMAATCALLAPAVKAQSADGEPTTKVDTGLLLYQEDHSRVRSVDGIAKLTHDFGDERVLTATGAIDVLTGGSPNGAVPQKFAQTFTTPSGSSLQQGGGSEDNGKLYTIAPGAQALDPNFRDLRVAGDLNWSQPLGIGNKLALGGHLSIEHEFRSIAGNAQFSHDFNSKNTTLGLGLSTEFDQVKPLGGVPLAGSDYTLLQKGGSDNKHVLGAQLGVTQVLARNWIAQLNFSLDKSGGYLNDPYKILSVVDATGVTGGYLFENRPGSRVQRSVWLGNKVALGPSVLDLSLRYGTDDWGIRSKTVEASYRLPIGQSMYLEPHLRWYQQNAADFYRLYLTAADLPASDMSADPRLGAFTAKTIGVKLGVPLANGSEVAVRLEGYQQDPKVHTSALPGLSGLDLNPRLRSIMLQVDWSFGL